MDLPGIILSFTIVSMEAICTSLGSGYQLRGGRGYKREAGGSEVLPLRKGGGG